MSQTNLHLGLINAPTLILFFPPNDLYHYSFTIKKARTILNYCQDFINLTGDTGCAILGVILGITHFLSKRDPPKSYI